MLTRRDFIASTAALALPLRPALAATPALTVQSRVIEVKGKAATVYGIMGPQGPGLFAREGDRFQGEVWNDTDTPPRRRHPFPRRPRCP